MEAYSLDLRQRVVAGCDEGFESRREVAERFGVSVSFVQKLLRRRKQTGSIAAKPRSGGKQSTLGAAALRWARRLLAEQIDATLPELCLRLERQIGLSVSAATMCRALAKLDITRKKRRCTPASGTRRVSAPCAGSGSGGPTTSPRRIWWLWTRAGPTRP
jgi:transposase